MVRQFPSPQMEQFLGFMWLMQKKKEAERNVLPNIGHGYTRSRNSHLGTPFG
ncbi:hypothetical protein TNIN_129021, partial [Trichonephila inaurata madagascariensis]